MVQQQVFVCVVEDEEHYGSAGTQAHDLGHQALVEGAEALLPVDGDNGAKSAAVFDLRGHRLGPLDARLGHVERYVDEAGQGAGQKADGHLAYELPGVVLALRHQILDAVIEAEVDHVEDAIAAHCGGQALVEASQSDAIVPDNVPRHIKGADQLLLAVRLLRHLHHLERIDGDRLQGAGRQTRQGEGQRSRCRRAKLKERLRLLEYQELNGPLWRLGQYWRHQTLPIRCDALLTVHLGEAVKHARVVHLHGAIQSF